VPAGSAQVSSGPLTFQPGRCLLSPPSWTLFFGRSLFDAANVWNDGFVTFVVDIAGNAADALSRVAANPSRYSLILLDMLLPDTNGYDMLPKLHSLTTNNAAVVMASANSQAELVQLCLRRGADAFMAKPLGCEDVRHIWQYVKELPDGSFKDDVTAARSSSKSAPSAPRSEPASTFEVSVQHTVLAAVAELDELNMRVCAGRSRLGETQQNVVLCTGSACASDASDADRGVRHAAGEPAGSCSSADCDEPCPPPAPRTGKGWEQTQQNVVLCTGSACASDASDADRGVRHAAGEPAGSCSSADCDEPCPPPAPRTGKGWEHEDVAHERYPRAPSGQGLQRHTSSESVSSGHSDSGLWTVSSLPRDHLSDSQDVAANCAQQ